MLQLAPDQLKEGARGLVKSPRPTKRSFALSALKSCHPERVESMISALEELPKSSEDDETTRSEKEDELVARFVPASPPQLDKPNMDNEVKKKGEFCDSYDPHC